MTTDRLVDELELHACVLGLAALVRSNGGPPAGHAALVERLRRKADDLSMSGSRRPRKAIFPVGTSRIGCQIAAEMLGISPRQVARYAASGRLGAVVMIGGALVLDEGQVRKVAEERARDGRNRASAAA